MKATLTAILVSLALVAPVAQAAGSKTITTTEQVREFQKKNGLAVDGKVGPQTLKAMAAQGIKYKPATAAPKPQAKTQPKGTGKPALMITPAAK